MPENIKKTLTDQLFWDSRMNATGIDVEVSENEVTLTGTVSSHAARLAAESDSMTIPGVSRVVNRLQVKYPNGQQLPSDVELRNNIKTVFIWNPNIDSTNIFVTVNDGFVRLEGSVNTYWQKKKAEEVASDITGVLGVENILVVEPLEKIIDEALAKRIIVSLERNPAIDVNQIHVKADAGAVTLMGKVPNWRVYKDVLKLVSHTVGVIDVVNNLQLEPE